MDCALAPQAYGGSIESSGLGDVFDNLAKHLTVAQSDFLKHWDRLIDLEAKESQVYLFYFFSSDHNIDCSQFILP